MTDFKIGYPSIPFNVQSITCTHTAETGFDADNLVTGSRHTGFQLASASASQMTLTYHLSSAMPAEYFYIGGARRLTGDSVFKAVLANGSTVYSTTSLAQYANKGPRAEDFLTTFNETASASTWTVALSPTAASFYSMDKVYFGKFLDMGREPMLPIEVTRDKQTSVAKAAPFAFQLQWAGVTNSAVAELTASVLQYADTNPVVLHDGGDCVLPYDIIFAKVTGHTITPDMVDSNTVIIDFEEDI